MIQTADSDTLTVPEVIATQALYVLGHRVTHLPAPGDTAILDIETAPGVPGPPPHHHDDADEFFYIVRGSFEVMCDGHWIRLEEGQTITVPRGSVHTFRNPTDETTRWITSFSPRDFERFFLDFGVPADQPDAFQASVAESLIRDVVARAADYGMILADG